MTRSAPTLSGLQRAAERASRYSVQRLVRQFTHARNNVHKPNARLLIQPNQKTPFRSLEETTRLWKCPPRNIGTNPRSGMMSSIRLVGGIFALGHNRLMVWVPGLRLSLLCTKDTWP